MILEVQDLHIEIEDHIIPETVVYDFDLEMDEGEIVGIVGESGSGKSMSALAIAGLLSRKDMKKQGRILFDGQDLLSISRSQLRQIQGSDIGIVFQEPMTSLNPVKKIGWQVEESLRIHTNNTDEENKKIVLEMLESVGLENPELVYNQYPHELSGGMRQRVMIASALVCKPKLLIADEPTTALDVTIQSQIIDLLKEVNKKFGIAILFISHDLSLVKRLCSRVLVMNKGRVVEAGPVDEIFNNPKEEYTANLIRVIPRFEKTTESKFKEEAKENSAGGDERKLLLEVKHLNAGYKLPAGFLTKKKDRRQILTDVSFKVYEGEIIALVGESGCGKTTLGKTVLGMLVNTEGEIKHYSQKPQMIFQDPYGSLNPAYSIGWILEEPLRIEGKLTDAERNEKVAKMLELVGLSADYASRKPNELSGGQRQRVCIALSLMLEPKLIVADEPVSALDVTIQSQILNLLLELNKKLGIAIIFISHDLKVVYEICDRVMVMQGGRIIEQGPYEQVYNRPECEYTKQLLKSAGYSNIL